MYCKESQLFLENENDQTNKKINIKIIYLMYQNYFKMRLKTNIQIHDTFVV